MNEADASSSIAFARQRFGEIHLSGGGFGDNMPL